MEQAYHRHQTQRFYPPQGYPRPPEGHFQLSRDFGPSFRPPESYLRYTPPGQLNSMRPDGMQLGLGEQFPGRFPGGFHPGYRDLHPGFSQSSMTVTGPSEVHPINVMPRPLPLGGPLEMSRVTHDHLIDLAQGRAASPTPQRTRPKRVKKRDFGNETVDLTQLDSDEEPQVIDIKPIVIAPKPDLTRDSPPQEDDNRSIQSREVSRSSASPQGNKSDSSSGTNSLGSEELMKKMVALAQFCKQANAQDASRDKSGDSNSANNDDAQRVSIEETRQQARDIVQRIIGDQALDLHGDNRSGKCVTPDNTSQGDKLVAAQHQRARELAQKVIDKERNVVGHQHQQARELSQNGIEQRNVEQHQKQTSAPSAGRIGVNYPQQQVSETWQQHKASSYGKSNPTKDNPFDQFKVRPRDAVVTGRSVEMNANTRMPVRPNVQSSSGYLYPSQNHQSIRHGFTNQNLAAMENQMQLLEQNSRMLNSQRNRSELNAGGNGPRYAASALISSLLDRSPHQVVRDNSPGAMRPSQGLQYSQDNIHNSLSLRRQNFPPYQFKGPNMVPGYQPGESQIMQQHPLFTPGHPRMGMPPMSQGHPVLQREPVSASHTDRDMLGRPQVSAVQATLQNDLASHMRPRSQGHPMMSQGHPGAIPHGHLMMPEGHLATASQGHPLMSQRHPGASSQGGSAVSQSNSSISKANSQESPSHRVSQGSPSSSFYNRFTPNSSGQPLISLNEHMSRPHSANPQGNTTITQARPTSVHGHPMNPPMYPGFPSMLPPSQGHPNTPPGHPMMAHGHKSMPQGPSFPVGHPPISQGHPSAYQAPSAVSLHHPAISQVRSPISESQALVSQVQPMASEDQTSISGGHLSMSQSQPMLSQNQALVSGGHPSLSHSQPIESQNQTLVSGGHLSLSQSQPTASQDQILISGGQPSLSQGQPIVSQTQTLISGCQPSLLQGQPTVSQDQTSVSGDQPSVSVGQLAMSQGKPSSSQDSGSFSKSIKDLQSMLQSVPPLVSTLEGPRFVPHVRMPMYPHGGPAPQRHPSMFLPPPGLVQPSLHTAGMPGLPPMPPLVPLQQEGVSETRTSGTGVEMSSILTPPGTPQSVKAVQDNRATETPSSQVTATGQGPSTSGQAGLINTQNRHHSQTARQPGTEPEYIEMDALMHDGSVAMGDPSSHSRSRIPTKGQQSTKYSPLKTNRQKSPKARNMYDKYHPSWVASKLSSYKTQRQAKATKSDPNYKCQIMKYSKRNKGKRKSYKLRKRTRKVSRNFYWEEDSDKESEGSATEAYEEEDNANSLFALSVKDIEKLKAECIANAHHAKVVLKRPWWKTLLVNGSMDVSELLPKSKRKKSRQSSNKWRRLRKPVIEDSSSSDEERGKIFASWAEDENNLQAHRPKRRVRNRLLSDDSEEGIDVGTQGIKVDTSTTGKLQNLTVSLCDIAHSPSQVSPHSPSTFPITDATSVHISPRNEQSGSLSLRGSEGPVGENSHDKNSCVTLSDRRKCNSGASGLEGSGDEQSMQKKRETCGHAAACPVIPQSTSQPETPARSTATPNGGSGSISLDHFTTEQLFQELCERDSVEVCKCGKIFKDKPLFYIHRGIHDTEIPLKCGSCAYSATDWRDFEVHLFLGHQEEETSPKQDH